MKSYLAKPADVTPKWYVVDATGQTLGRLAVRIANIIRGRHKPTYTPHTDTGDFVVVINSEKVKVTGKKELQKHYMFYSGWMGGEKYVSLAEFRQRNPEFIIENAVRGMLPRNRLATQQLKKLKAYAGETHPHAAQNPQTLAL